MQFNHSGNGLSETVYGPCIFIGKRIIADQLVNRFFYNVNAEHCKAKHEMLLQLVYMRTHILCHNGNIIVYVCRKACCILHSCRMYSVIII